MKNNEQSIAIRIAQSDEDRAAVYRFRYEVYVEELGWKQHYANHERRKVEEPLDATGVIVAAFQGDEVVGTVRRNFGLTCDLGYYLELCEMAKYAGDAYPRQVSMTTKMLVAAAHRNSLLPTRIGIEAYRATWNMGARLDFITVDVNLKHLERYYKRIGYVEYREPAEHPEFGPSRLMVCRFRDLSHLIKVRSPYVDVCRECLAADAHKPQEKIPLVASVAAYA
ncbi:MAG: hypothetical protein SFU56_12935 [Capsulimonadales bacterium]|nr:hypothetical protein [Capsulimonadales bacterium]